MRLKTQLVIKADIDAQPPRAWPMSAAEVRPFARRDLNSSNQTVPNFVPMRCLYGLVLRGIEKL
jgi:hypothetical protein